MREIVQRVLHGENLTAIARDLNQRGVHSPGWYARRQPTGDETEEPKPISDTWLPISVKHLVVRESNVSQRKHRGKVVGPGTWPPLISQDDHDRARSILLAPERHQHRDGRRHHLLTNGIGVCGICGGVLGVLKRALRHDLPLRPRGCVARRLSLVDDMVDAVIVARQVKPDVAGAFGARRRRGTGGARSGADCPCSG